MNIQHHPDKSTLLAYSAGVLNEGVSLLVAAHSFYCPHCREEIEKANSIGAKMMHELKPEQVPENGFADLWKRIEQQPQRIESHKVETMSSSSNLPNVLLPYIDTNFDNMDWKTLAPGIKQIIFHDVKSHQGSVRLFKIDPGVKIPHHTHRGNELTLVLKGSYEDEIGVFNPGDLADLDGSDCHQPRVTSDEPCICLIATEEKLKFTNPINRILQPIFGI